MGSYNRRRSLRNSQMESNARAWLKAIRATLRLDREFVAARRYETRLLNPVGNLEGRPRVVRD